jgi:hypothetical protein
MIIAPYFGHKGSYRHWIVPHLPRGDRRDWVLYCDPPYVQSTRKSRDRRHVMGAPRRQYAYDWTDADHRRLAHLLTGHQAIVSGYASPLYNQLFAGWQTQRHGDETIWLSPQLLGGCGVQGLLLNLEK